MNKKFVFPLVVVILGVLFADCSSEQGANLVIEIIHQPQENVNIPAGGSATLSITTKVSDNVMLTYQWYSSATNNNKEGTIIINATSSDYTLPTNLNPGTTYYFFCVISSANGKTSVRTNVITVIVGAFVSVTGINAVPSAATAGTPLTLTGTVAPSNATNQTIAWSIASAGTTGASIAAGSNILNATAAGTATVRATIANGASVTTPFTQDFTISVAAAFVPVTSITGVPSTASADIPLILTGTVTPSNATNQTIAWSIANAGTTGASIAAGSNILNATAAGTATVRATIANGSTTTTPFTQDFTISVATAFVPVTSITGVPSTATAGTLIILTGTVAPSNATNQTIAWSIANAGTTGASISGSNILYTTAAGTATVRATIANGASVTTPFTQDFTISVATAFVPVTSITGVPSTATAGIPLILTGTVTPSNATNQTIAWSIANAGTTGASIAGSNILNTTAAGTATVRATITNGATASTPYTQDFTISVSRAALSGTVSVSGSAVFGQTLTASTASLTSTPEIPNLGTLSYQWQRGTTNINGATSSTYTLVQADIGNQIRVVVTAENCSGNVNSASSSVVTKASQTTAPAPPTLASSTINSITLTAFSGCEYNMGSGMFQSSTLFSGLTASTAYSFTQRFAETPTHLASPASTAVIFNTPPFNGDGSAISPYLITNATDLVKLSEIINAAGSDYYYAHYRQTANISLNGNWTPIWAFSGTYDGQGYSITNLTITGTDNNSNNQRGLFSILQENGLVRNVILTGVNINTSRVYNGGIVGQNHGRIEFCHVAGNIIGGLSTGGIAGVNFRVIENCSTTCNVTGTDTNSAAGGIAGLNGGNVEKCYATGTITGSSGVGGLVGMNNGGTIENCYSICSVTGTATNSVAGGIAGFNQGNVEKCYATGVISGQGSVGGVVGNNTTSVTNCVALNSVLKEGAAGRIVGKNVYPGTLNNNYARSTGMSVLSIFNGTTTVITDFSDPKHGIDVSAIDYNGTNSATWWGSTVGFSTAVWSLSNGRLPWLNGLPGQPQNPVVQ